MNNTKKEKPHFGATFLFGGDGEDRTLDLYTASVALSQLSYAPVFEVKSNR